jgi:membrane protein DedA with SNARE-associated domain
MNSIDMFLVQYGLAAIFLLMFAKSVGVPIPVPADLIVLTTAASVAAGKLVLWQAFGVILLALVCGGLIQFVLARGPGRNLLYRFGRYIGLTSARLNAAASKVKKGGIVGISVAILVPGVRGAAIVASGLANVSLRTFVPGLLVGSTAFLSLHFFLGYIGGSLLAILGRILPLPSAVALIIVLLVLVYGLWLITSRRQKTASNDVKAESAEVWHEGICPICLALYSTNRLHTPPA